MEKRFKEKLIKFYLNCNVIVDIAFIS